MFRLYIFINYFLSCLPGIWFTIFTLQWWRNLCLPLPQILVIFLLLFHSICWAIVLLAKARLYNFSSFWCHVILLWARAVEVYRWLPDPEILKPSLIALLFLFSWKILVSSVLVRFLKFSWFLCCPRQNWHISYDWVEYCTWQPVLNDQSVFQHIDSGDWQTTA